MHIPSTKQSTVGKFPQPQRLITKGFCRVTKQRLCRVCGKTDWCGYSIDEQTTICMRISSGSKGTSRNGGNIFHHSRLFLVGNPRANRMEVPTRIRMAAIEICNEVYGELIRRSPALKYYSQLIDGPHGLLSRGLRQPDLQNYGALPRTQKERTTLARTLNMFVRERFPEDALRSVHDSVIGVPGFWQDESGIIRLWKDRDYNMPLLVIPYRDGQGRIQACQIRLHRNDIPAGQKKYRWLALPLERNGTSSGTPLHFTFSETLPPGQTVIITEGALKAETVRSLRPRSRLIATSGVSCSHAEIIEAARSYNALIAFDSDYKTNPAVARQLARLIATREQDIAAHHLKTTTRIVIWQRYKGIDDALLANSSLEILDVPRWYSTLESKTHAEVKRVWDEADYRPWISRVKR